MASVRNLAIKIQGGTGDVAVATWDFESTVTVVTPTVSVGAWVNIKAGSTWYNGSGIPSWVYGSGPWKVIELRGDRAVINENQSNTNRIQSPINVSDLVGTDGGSVSVTEDTVEDYSVKWAYDAGDGTWYAGSESSVEETSATWSIPDNALRIRATVTPNAKSRDVNGQDTPYWTGTAVSCTYDTAANPPEVPPSPGVEIEGFRLVATVDDISDPRSDEIDFEVYDMQSPFSTATATVRACMASATFNVNAGGRYRVRARGSNIYGTSRVKSDWTDFTDPASTVPAAPSGITSLRATSATSIMVEWPQVNSAETYEVEWATRRDAFDTSDETEAATGIEATRWELTGLEPGSEYFVRVRAANAQGESAWTAARSVAIGSAPSAPTTWSGTTTAMVGEAVTLWWVHNASDGSAETYAEVEVTTDGDRQTHTVRAQDSQGEGSHSWDVDTSSLKEGATIEWRVRTAGVTKEYGPWSASRRVDVYAPPTLALTVTDAAGALLTVVNSFPFYVRALPGPATQAPLGYHVSVTAQTGYETVDGMGRPQTVSAGQAVYSEYVDAREALLLEMDPSNVDLQSGVAYTVAVTASMDSGLTAGASCELEVSWQDEEYSLDCSVTVDKDTLTAYVCPWCRDADGAPADGVTISVYRRDADGAYTLVSSGIAPGGSTVAVDPHPALDRARYRLVATSAKTGAVSWYDPPGHPVGERSLVIQWDEAWADLDGAREDERTDGPQWSGSMVRLPWNIQTSEAVETDVELVSYAGRKYPVAYHGVPVTSAASWSADIERGDAETLAALRRLAAWAGDCYVREPTGTGYWASVAVSMDHDATSSVVPVSIDVTRVEGGA